MAPNPGGYKPRAIGSRPKHVPNNREGIVRIIEGRNKMHDCKDDIMGSSPIGEKPWPPRLAIPAMIKFICRLYMWGCTIGVSAFIVYYCVTG